MTKKRCAVCWKEYFTDLKMKFPLECKGCEMTTWQYFKGNPYALILPRKDYTKSMQNKVDDLALITNKDRCGILSLLLITKTLKIGPEFERGDNH